MALQPVQRLGPTARETIGATAPGYPAHFALPAHFVPAQRVLRQPGDSVGRRLLSVARGSISETSTTSSARILPQSSNDVVGRTKPLVASASGYAQKNTRTHLTRQALSGTEHPQRYRTAAIAFNMCSEGRDPSLPCTSIPDCIGASIGSAKRGEVWRSNSQGFGPRDANNLQSGQEQRLGIRSIEARPGPRRRCAAGQASFTATAGPHPQHAR